MDPKQIDLLERIRSLIQDNPQFAELTRDVEDLNKLPLGNLLLEMEKFFDRAATVKSALSYFEEYIGLDKPNCIVIVVVSSLWVLGPLSKAIRDMNESTRQVDYLVARAYNYADGLQIINFFRLHNLVCGLIVESILPNGEAPALIRKCRDLPVTVIIHNPNPDNVIHYIADGATNFVDIAKKGAFLNAEFKKAIGSMFLP